MKRKRQFVFEKKMQSIIFIGIVFIIIGFLLVFFGSLIYSFSQAKHLEKAGKPETETGKPKVSVGAGGFIGPIPFGFATDKRMLYVIIGLCVALAIVWYVFNYMRFH